MTQEIKSEGKCLYCGKTYSKSAITRHLATHQAREKGKNKSGTSFTVKVEAKSYYCPPASYFLLLRVDGETTLYGLDSFLRSVWLECCGHQSCFRKPYGSVKIDYTALAQAIRTHYEQTGNFNLPEDNFYGDDDYSNVFPMEEKARDIFYPKLKIKYEYDFGSTTELTLTVTHRYEVEADGEIVLLSRNEPPAIYCHSCNKNIATCVCTVHGFNDECVFCDNCAKQHAKNCADFEEYSAMHIVNSPRFGICAYGGGMIDRERDGIYGR